MKITKQYIEENLLTKRGLNPNLTRKLLETTEELYLIYNELTEVPKCSGGNKCRFQSFTKGHRLTCGSKNCECYKDRYKRTLETLKKTNMERYGVKCNFSLKKNKEKEKVTKLKKYGDENYNNRDSAIKTNREKGTYEKNNIKAKITSKKRYGNATYRNIEKQKKTKLERYGDENYNNIEQGSPKRLKTMEEKGLIIPKSEKSDWELYKSGVRRITERNYKKYKEKINPDNFNRVLCGEEGYQLDHIISIYRGFKENIPICIIGSIDNLQMLHWKDNRSKWK